MDRVVRIARVQVGPEMRRGIAELDDGQFREQGRKPRHHAFVKSEMIRVEGQLQARRRELVDQRFGVDRHRRPAEVEQEHDRGGLAADPRQRRQPLTCLVERQGPEEAKVPGPAGRGVDLGEDVLNALRLGGSQAAGHFALRHRVEVAAIAVDADTERLRLQLADPLPAGAYRVRLTLFLMSRNAS